MSRAPRGDEGFTLVEMLVAIALMGIGVAAVLSGIMTSIVTSDVHRKQATGETVMRGYAEEAKQVTYSSCATTYTIPYSAPNGYTVVLEGVDYWNGTAWAAQPAPTCASTPTVQRLRLATATDDGRGAESVEVVVRKP